MRTALPGLQSISQTFFYFSVIIMAYKLVLFMDLATKKKRNVDIAGLAQSGVDAERGNWQRPHN